VYAAYNHLPGHKELCVYPYNEHEGGGIFQLQEKLRFLQSL
jgi:cephalosporin-C deacetylase